MARYRQLVRCLQMARILKGCPEIELNKLVEIFEVHERTIRRDLVALEAAGAVVPRRIQQWDVSVESGHVSH